MNQNNAKKDLFTDSHCDKILYHLIKGNRLTALQALTMFGCFRLGARIFDLKKFGHDIETEMILEKAIRKGKTITKQYARYFMPEYVKKQEEKTEKKNSEKKQIKMF